MKTWEQIEKQYILSTPRLTLFDQLCFQRLPNSTNSFECSANPQYSKEFCQSYSKRPFSQAIYNLKIRDSRNKKNQGSDLTFFNGCKCSKIGCLKLYCECFSNNLQCTQFCSCKCCGNNQYGDQAKILEAKMLINAKVPNYFEGIPAKKTPKRCHCRKSKCMKRYCECYANGIKCGQQCQCQGCQNCSKQDPFQGQSRVFLLNKLKNG